MISKESASEEASPRQGGAEGVVSPVPPANPHRNRASSSLESPHQAQPSRRPSGPERKPGSPPSGGAGKIVDTAAPPTPEASRGPAPPFPRDFTLAAAQPPLSLAARQAVWLAQRLAAAIGAPATYRRFLIAALFATPDQSAARAFFSLFSVTTQNLAGDLASSLSLYAGLDLEAMAADAAKQTEPVNQELRLTSNTIHAIWAGCEAARNSSSETSPAHLFLGAMRSAVAYPGYLDRLLGTEETAWVLKTLEGWPSGAPISPDAVRMKALTSGIAAPPTAFNDGASKDDLLGFEASVNALVKIVLKQDTRPPLVVGVYGPWGSGKSTFLAQIKRKLDDQSAAARKAKDKSAVQLITLHYDAWAYSDAKTLWSGLVTRVAKELEAGIGWRARLRYSISRRLTQLVWAAVLGLLPVVGALITLTTAGVSEWLAGSPLKHGALSAGALLCYVSAYLLQRSPVSKSVASITAKFDSEPLNGVVHSIREELTSAIKKKVEPAEPKPDIYGPVAQNKLKIVIFIDELDRCPLERIVDILQAVKLFLAEEIFITFLAIDTRVAAEAIRLHYKDVQNPDLPLEYIEKIVQIPVGVPSSGRDGLTKYLGSLLKPPVSPETTSAPEPPGRPGATDSAVPAGPSRDPGDQGGPTPATAIAGAPGERTIHPRSRLLSMPNFPDTQAEFDCLLDVAQGLLGGNPRRIKRLLNTYRYVKLIAAARLQPVESDQWQRCMITWLSFTMRWPSLIERVADAAAGATQSPIDLLERLARAERVADRPAPSEAEIAAHRQLLPINAATIKTLCEIGGNFLIENPVSNGEKSKKKNGARAKSDRVADSPASSASQ